MHQLLRPQPLVIRACVPAPPHEAAAGNTPRHRAVEQQLRLVLSHLPRVRHWARSRRRASPLAEGPEQVDVDRRAALRPPRERERIGVGAWACRDPEGAVPPRPQRADISGVEQLLAWCKAGVKLV